MVKSFIPNNKRECITVAMVKLSLKKKKRKKKINNTLEHDVTVRGKCCVYFFFFKVRRKEATGTNLFPWHSTGLMQYIDLLISI